MSVERWHKKVKGKSQIGGKLFVTYIADKVYIQNIWKSPTNQRIHADSKNWIGI
jgi:hypothetical protein